MGMGDGVEYDEGCDLVECCKDGGSVIVFVDGGGGGGGGGDSGGEEGESVEVTGRIDGDESD